MRDLFHRMTQGVPVPVFAATFALGLAGGAVFWLAGVPLGMLIGALVTVAAAAVFGVRLFGSLPRVPLRWRDIFVPVIGLAIGASVPQDALAQAAGWWVTLLALLLFVPVMHFAGYQTYRRLGRLDPVTAFYAAMPGGFIEALSMGEKAGAEPRMLVTLQFTRIVLCIIAVPLAFALVTGQSVGSGSGMTLPGQEEGLRTIEALALVAMGAFGWWAAVRLRMPAPVLIGPLALSGAAHGFGLIQAAPPEWAILFTQWVIGTSLGTRFAGMERVRLWLGLRLAALYVTAAMVLAVAVALTLAGPVGESIPAVILAFAPGGISEMSLVAVSLQTGAVYVTLHHLLRIVLAVVMARLGAGLLPEREVSARGAQDD